MSILSRSEHVVVDNIGMDPLRDTSYEAIMSVETFRYHTVTDSEQFNAPLISFNMYDSPDLWWILLAYNGILDAFNLTSGTQLRIPDQNEIISALSIDNETVPNNQYQEL